MADRHFDHHFVAVSWCYWGQKAYRDWNQVVMGLEEDVMIALDVAVVAAQASSHFASKVTMYQKGDLRKALMKDFETFF